MSTVRSVLALARERNLTYMAAGIAYYAFVSVLPLMLLAVAVASFLGGEALAARVIGIFDQQLSSSGQEIVTRALTDASGRGIASAVGLVGLLWSGLKLFRGLDQAFDDLYTDDLRTPLVEQVWNGIVAGSGIVLAVALVVATGAALSALPVSVPFADALGALVLVVVLTLVFLPIYYVLPPVEVSVREVLPGAVVAAVGWVGLQVGFRVYASGAGRYGAYGLIGSILLFVTWLYFASIVVLLGSTVNAVRWRSNG